MKPDMSKWPYDDLPRKDSGVLMQIKEPDKVNPCHYQGKGMEVIDVIDAFELDLYQGSIVQYVIRYKKKEGITDLKKAKWYLDRMIDKLEKDNA